MSIFSVSSNVSGINVGSSWCKAVYLGTTAVFYETYTAGTLSPDLALDFASEYYRTGGTDTDLVSAATHARASTATYTDASGILQTAAINEPRVGHHSKTPSPELVTNGAFDTDTTGWTHNNSSGTSTFSVTGGEATFTRDIFGDSFFQEDVAPPVAGVYRLTFDITAISGGDLRYSFSPNSAANTANREAASSVGSYATDFVSDGTLLDFVFDLSANGASVTIDNISVREVTPWVNEGYLHESEARTNLVTYSDLSSGWGETRSVLSFNQGISPDGTNNATKLTSDLTVLNSHSSSELVNAPAVDSKVITSIFLKEDTLRYAQIRITDNAANVNGGINNYDVHFDLRDGVITSQAGYSGTAIAPVAYIENAGNGWFRCSVGLTKAGDALRTDVALYLAQAGVVSNNTGFTGTGAESILIYGAQLEAGSTPSSYIPTSGSTVTRAADTLTVPSANLPWPEPVVIGDELVTNGTFDTDTSGWNNPTADIASVGGELQVSNQSNSPNNTTQTLSVEVGKVYKVEATYRQEGTGGTAARLSLLGKTTPNNSTSTPLTASIIVYATTTSATLSLASFGTVDTISYFDNISVREINPLAVSIQMEGTVTYAEDGGNFTVQFTDWQADSSNNIAQSLTTKDTTGAFRTRQEADNVGDVVSGLPYSPGISVPFNIASRHGSTFINGAVDGVALTANTTPVALPDLSSTDMDIGSTFMGTIKLFRVWADDLTDAGIEEATT